MFYKKIVQTLEEGLSARNCELTAEESLMIQDSHLLTLKPIVYVCNISESEINETSEYVQQVQNYAESQGASTIKLSAKVESEVAEIDAADRQEFLNELGLEKSGLDRMIQEGYRLLNLITFFTAGPKECRAWSITNGIKSASGSWNHSLRF